MPGKFGSPSPMGAAQLTASVGQTSVVTTAALLERTGSGLLATTTAGLGASTEGAPPRTLISISTTMVECATISAYWQ
jgi:hypothetical protein